MVASALALPLTFGMAGIASADAVYGEEDTYTTAGGSGTHSMNAYADDYGNHFYIGGGHVSYTSSDSHAGPDGATLETTNTHAGIYGVGYGHNEYGAGEHGAWSNHFQAHADGHGNFSYGGGDVDLDVEHDDDHDDHDD